MAIVTEKATILTRRGLKKDFDPDQMTAGEWAVSIDTVKENQIVWMCFAPGVVKRMGTWDDFQNAIQDISDDIADVYIQAFDEIKASMEALEAQTEAYKNTASQKATEAAVSAQTATTQTGQAASSASMAAAKADAAADSAGDAQDYATKAESYTHGGTGTRPGEDADNAKYYYDQARDVSQSITGALKPKGTVAFAELPPLSAAEEGGMYNISDQFTTTADFREGAGHVIPAGANVYKTTDGKWDVLAGTPVAGVKGAKESAYRTGNVELSADDIGAPTTDEAYLLKGGTPIPEGADVSSPQYRVPGNYYCDQTSTVKTLSGCPMKEAFQLKVVLGTGTGYPTQIFIPYRYNKGEDKNILIRGFNLDGTSWAYSSKIANVGDALPVTGGTVSGDTSINGIKFINFNVSDQEGKMKWIIMFDVTTWYDAYGTSQNISAKAFNGFVNVFRGGSYIANTANAKIDMACSYRRESESVKDNSNSCRLRTDFKQVRPTIIKSTENKYFLALSITGSDANVILTGRFTGNYIGNILYADTKGTDLSVNLPTGYELVSGDYIFIDSAEETRVKDTKGLVGAAGADSNVQALIDEIADRVIDKLLTKDDAASKYALKRLLGVTESSGMTNIEYSFPDVDAGSSGVNMGSSNLNTALGQSSSKMTDQILKLRNMSYLLKGGTEIPANADMNADAYKVPGNYYCNYSNIASTLVNLPLAKKEAFILKVDNPIGARDGFIRQTFINWMAQEIVRRSYDPIANIWLDAVYTTKNTDVVNSLDSTSTDRPLSADMGRKLNQNIDKCLHIDGTSEAASSVNFNLNDYISGIIAVNGWDESVKNHAFTGQWYTLVASGYWGERIQYAFSEIGNIRYRRAIWSNQLVWESWKNLYNEYSVTDLSVNSGVVTDGYLYLHRMGKICIITIGVTITANAGNEIILAYDAPKADRTMVSTAIGKYTAKAYDVWVVNYDNNLRIHLINNESSLAIRGQLVYFAVE